MNETQVGIRPRLWNNVCKLVLVAFLIFYLILAFILPSSPYGESPSHLLATVSLTNGNGFRITEDDYCEFCVLFPEHVEYGDGYYHNRLPKDENGNIYALYFGAYPILCIPAFLFLRLLRLNAVYAFSLTNALLLATALWVVYRYLRVDIKRKLVVICFLGASPVIRYINIQLYEVSLCAMVIMSITFWVSGRRKLSAFFLALGGSMNVAFAVFGFAMIADYFWEIFLSSEKRIDAFIKNCLRRWKDIALYALCFVPCLIPILLCYNALGMPTTTFFDLATYEVATCGFDGIIQRVWGFLTDLNLGLWPYMNIVLVMFFVLCIWGTLRKNYHLFFALVGALAVLATYSYSFWIDSGMIGISRYNAWSFPIFVIVTVFSIEQLANRQCRCAGTILCTLSALLCICLVAVVWYSPTNGNSLYYSPLAEAVLDRAPSLYNPVATTFKARTDHLDDFQFKFNVTDDVVYVNSEGYVRKALVTTETMNQCRAKLFANGKDQTMIEEEFAKVKKDGKYYYLNFPQSKIQFFDYLYELGTEVYFDATEKDGRQFFPSGLSSAEVGYTWTTSKEVPFVLPISDDVQTELVLKLNIGEAYMGSQRMVVDSVAGVLFDQELDTGGEILIYIPYECVENRLLKLNFSFPEAIDENSNGGIGMLAVTFLSFSVCSGE